MEHYADRFNVDSLNPTLQEWLNNLYTEAIEEAEQTIRNERIWEKGYDGEDANPHTENIETLNQYISVLTQLRADIQPKAVQEESRYDIMLNRLSELIGKNGLAPTLLNLGFSKSELEKEGILKEE